MIDKGASVDISCHQDLEIKFNKGDAMTTAKKAIEDSVTAFIGFLQIKGVWQCEIPLHDYPEVLPADAVFKLKDEFLARM